MVAMNDTIEKVLLVCVLSFPKCYNDLFEGKTDELVVQVNFVSLGKTNRLEGNSSGVD
jgi:hypothetical protein